MSNNNKVVLCSKASPVCGSAGGVQKPCTGGQILIREKLDALIDAFVALWGATRQHTPDWYAAMAETVGGSELSAILDQNPYMSFFDVVARKAAARTGKLEWDPGSPACWWGSLFEAVVGRVLELDCATRLKGDKICVQRFAGHRNSPDGYCVVTLVLLSLPISAAEVPGITGTIEPVATRSKMSSASETEPDEEPDVGSCIGAQDAQPPAAVGGTWRLHTNDEPPPEHAVEAIALVEFKCPLRRKPDGKIPKQYAPQVQSGLAVSPIASLGLFVDAVFRKCAFGKLGPGKAYDWDFHREKATWDKPHAWGIIAVYAPFLDAEPAIRLRKKAGSPGPAEDVAFAAWLLAVAAMGSTEGAESVVLDGDAFIDFGSSPPAQFNPVLGHINSGAFPVIHADPCFADGRNRDQQDRLRDIAAMRAAAPTAHYLLGVVPWKLFEIHYVPVQREPGFMARVEPRIAEVHELARAAVASGSPRSFLAEKKLERDRTRVRRRAPKAATASCDPGSDIPPCSELLDESAVDDFFSELSAV